MSTPQAASHKCPICMEILSGSADDRGGGPHYDCPYCGKFGVSDFFSTEKGEIQLGINERIKIKHLLFENRLKGGGPLFIATTSGGMARDKPMISVEELLQRYPQSPLDYFDRVLENLSRMVNHPVAFVPLNKSLWPALFSENNNAAGMLNQLETLGYIAQSSSFIFQVTPKGWARLHEIQRPGRDAKQAFVAMWFDPSHSEYYEKGFVPAIEADGKVRALRIDRKDHNNKIDDEIVAEIRRSRYLVADFTEHRGGVYFEAGFALGLGIPVIWCVHEKDIDKSHFDTRQYNHITYSSPEDLRVKLLNRIRATIS